MTNFEVQLGRYKQAIDDDIAAYAAHVRKTTQSQFGAHVAEEVNTFLEILSRGGKRIRGVLVLTGYEMCGGTDRAMILQAARAIEMLHAYLLMVDDIQDRSSVRRGKPAAHMLLADYHRRHHLKGDAEHTGNSLALNAAFGGAHAAQAILANLDADPQLRLNALSIVNRTMAITAHGQTQDIMNQLLETPTAKDIDRVLEWKSALYSFINPLHVGMVLAGAGCDDTDAITPYALHLGKAFQITDDLLGTFGNEKITGKNPMDDIREGKATLLSTYALQHAEPSAAAYLARCLGNPKLATTAFTRCKTILETSGAKAYAEQQAAGHAAAARSALDNAAPRWKPQYVDFLRQLVALLEQRSN
ncbi:MAG TPA: polyprenyl synthetase family protein [Candidatus Saccharimonadales bacterium]|nr:polyprenyl synthetase family protein [Candidatus Saccharimonadales bacterium]